MCKTLLSVFVVILLIVSGKGDLLVVNPLTLDPEEVCFPIVSNVSMSVARVDVGPATQVLNEDSSGSIAMAWKSGPNALTITTNGTLHYVSPRANDVALSMESLLNYFINTVYPSKTCDTIFSLSSYSSVTLGPGTSCIYFNYFSMITNVNITLELPANYTASAPGLGVFTILHKSFSTNPTIIVQNFNMFLGNGVKDADVLVLLPNTRLTFQNSVFRGVVVTKTATVGNATPNRFVGSLVTSYLTLGSQVLRLGSQVQWPTCSRVPNNLIHNTSLISLVVGSHRIYDPVNPPPVVAWGNSITINDGYGAIGKMDTRYERAPVITATPASKIYIGVDNSIVKTVSRQRYLMMRELLRSPCENLITPTGLSAPTFYPGVTCLTTGGREGLTFTFTQFTFDALGNTSAVFIVKTSNFALNNGFTSVHINGASPNRTFVIGNALAPLTTASGTYDLQAHVMLSRATLAESCILRITGSLYVETTLTMPHMDQLIINSIPLPNILCDENTVVRCITIPTSSFISLSSIAPPSLPSLPAITFDSSLFCGSIDKQSTSISAISVPSGTGRLFHQGNGIMAIAYRISGGTLQINSSTPFEFLSRPSHDSLCNAESTMNTLFRGVYADPPCSTTVVLYSNNNYTFYPEGTCIIILSTVQNINITFAKRNAESFNHRLGAFTVIHIGSLSSLTITAREWNVFLGSDVLESDVLWVMPLTSLNVRGSTLRGVFFTSLLDTSSGSGSNIVHGSTITLLTTLSTEPLTYNSTVTWPKCALQTLIRSTHPSFAFVGDRHRLYATTLPGSYGYGININVMYGNAAIATYLPTDGVTVATTPIETTSVYEGSTTSTVIAVLAERNAMAQALTRIKCQYNVIPAVFSNQILTFTPGVWCVNAGGFRGSSFKWTQITFDTLGNSSAVIIVKTSSFSMNQNFKTLHVNGSTPNSTFILSDIMSASLSGSYQIESNIMTNQLTLTQSCTLNITGSLSVSRTLTLPFQDQITINALPIPEIVIEYDTNGNATSFKALPAGTTPFETISPPPLPPPPMLINTATDIAPSTRILIVTFASIAGALVAGFVIAFVFGIGASAGVAPGAVGGAVGVQMPSYQPITQY